MLAIRESDPIFRHQLGPTNESLDRYVRELGRILDCSRACRFPTALFDTLHATRRPILPELVDGTMVQPFYTLGDQLFVEPQPHAVPDVFDLERPIRMSQAEVAVACSHIGIWKTIAQSSAPYSLVLEDDIRFERGFGRILDQAWREMEDADRANPGSTSCTFRMERCATVLQRS